MVKHVILWNLKDELSEEEKNRIKAGIKEGLEGLKGQIPGLIDIRVNIDPLASSNCDVMLDSSFETEEALKGYAVHPAHVAVADGKVRPFTKSRVCMDYEVIQDKKPEYAPPENIEMCVYGPPEMLGAYRDKN